METIARLAQDVHVRNVLVIGVREYEVSRIIETTGLSVIFFFTGHASVAVLWDTVMQVKVKEQQKAE